MRNLRYKSDRRDVRRRRVTKAGHSFNELNPLCNVIQSNVSSTWIMPQIPNFILLLSKVTLPNSVGELFMVMYKIQFKIYCSNRLSDTQFIIDKVGWPTQYSMEGTRRQILKERTQRALPSFFVGHFAGSILQENDFIRFSYCQ